MNIIIQSAKDRYCRLLCYLSNVTVRLSQAFVHVGRSGRVLGRIQNQNTGKERERRKKMRYEMSGMSASVFRITSVVWVSGGSRALLFQQVTQQTPANKWRWMQLISRLPKLHIHIETHTRRPRPLSPSSSLSLAHTLLYCWSSSIFFYLFQCFWLIMNKMFYVTV